MQTLLPAKHAGSERDPRPCGANEFVLNPWYPLRSFSATAGFSRTAFRGGPRRPRMACSHAYLIVASFCSIERLGGNRHDSLPDSVQPGR